MEHNRKSHPYRQFAVYVVLLYFLFALLPFGIYHLNQKDSSAHPPSENTNGTETKTLPTPEKTDSPPALPGFLDDADFLDSYKNSSILTDSPEEFSIKDLATGEILTVAAKDFLPAALVCEMPLSAPDESLKAQAVAIYTYYTAQRKASQEKGAEFDFTVNSDKWLIYTLPEKMKECWGEDYDTYWNKAKSLTDSVYGELLTVNSEPILAAYFAMSNGSTEASANVWGAEVSYLTSVASPGDLLSDGYLSTVVYTAEQIEEKLKTELSEFTFDFTLDKEKWFENQELSEAGYTKTISVCGTTIEGTKLRTALSLSSTSFEIDYDNSLFTFTVKGRGHGVGMSQVGAMYMAQQGSSYQQILSHYYPGTTLIQGISNSK